MQKNMQKEMTVEQVIQITIDNLQRIPITVGEVERIGIPIQQSVSNLEECIKAFRRERGELPDDGWHWEPVAEDEKAEAQDGEPEGNCAPAEEAEPDEEEPEDDLV